MGSMKVVFILICFFIVQISVKYKLKNFNGHTPPRMLVKHSSDVTEKGNQNGKEQTIRQRKKEIFQVRKESKQKNDSKGRVKRKLIILAVPYPSLLSSLIIF